MLLLRRCEATHCLAVVANAMASTWEGPPAMLVMFKKMFGSFAAGHMVRQNDFSSLQCYFIQKEIPRCAPTRTPEFPAVRFLPPPPRRA